MNRRAIMVLTLLLCSEPARAQQANDKSILRIDGTHSIESISFHNGIEGDSVAGLGFAGAATYQSSQGFYGQIAAKVFALSSFDWFNAGIYDAEKKEAERGAGIGYRVNVNDSDGIYLGFGYSNTETRWENSSNSFNTVKVFLEKERDRRYGNVTISHNEGDKLRSLSIDGRYIWFFGRSDWGMGLSWAIGDGRIYEELDIRQKSVGMVVMYRPRFGF